ncbi:hypothetical protein [Desulfosarcina sp.]|uniref:hypothetical protein n=1 Tax=Desulfosarcina sp. TaxID=2027861 RepID=UPI00397074C4
MKIAEGLKMIENGWIRKPKGFRVKFDKLTAAGFEVGYSPPLSDAPLTSDVTAWRYAWKLGQATRTGAQGNNPGVLYNIVVVDDLDRPVRFYGTGELELYNPKPIDGGNGHKAE